MADRAPTKRPPKAPNESLLRDLRLSLEHKTIIPLVEGVMRLWFHFDPRVYSERMRIRSISEGNIDLKSNRFAIFVLYSKASLPAFTLNAIDAIERSSLNLVLVSNGELDPIVKAQLLDRCHLLIERSNLGRDFGAYRDGISVLLQRFKNIERLILLNDSLFYFERGLADLISRLDGKQEFIGVTEVFEHHYHVQSFALSFGARVVRSKHFKRYWKRYRPISTRRWSIHKGEVALTRRLTRAGFRPHILYQAAELVPCLGVRPIREILESVCLLPNSFRPRLYYEFDRILGGEGGAESLNAIEAISQGIRDFRNGRNTNFNESTLQKIGEQAENMGRWSFDIFTSKIVSTIAAHNQIHLGGFLFMKYLGLPAIKRDIFYREVYALEDIHKILSDFGEPLRDEAMADLRRGGTAGNLKGFLKLLHRHGSI